jgi:hypothetical protein
MGFELFRQIRIERQHKKSIFAAYSTPGTEVRQPSVYTLGHTHVCSFQLMHLVTIEHKGYLLGGIVFLGALQGLGKRGEKILSKNSICRLTSRWLPWREGHYRI